MKNIQMVDLKGQYAAIKDVVNSSIQEVIDNASFINGPKVKAFQANLEAYLGVKHVIPSINPPREWVINLNKPGFFEMAKILSNSIN